MVKSLKQHAVSMLVGGLLVAFGLWMGTSFVGSDAGPWESRFPGFPQRVLHASSATGGDSFALATGVVDEDAEAVFVLDFLTGTLQCSVLNHRTGKFSAVFKANVAKDLGVTKNSTYQMVTGVVDFRNGGIIPFRPGMSVVYVLDSSTGRMMAYGIPWRRGVASTARLQVGLLQPIDALQVRDASIREQ